MKVKIVVGLLLGIMALFAASSAYALPVIPGAAGYGMDTPAGRGGKVYKVTSLEDLNIPGTLRYAVSQSGPRVVIFEVSGTITINNYLDILDPYITIAGQTAPSPGIFLRGGNIRILTHDVLIQHIRVAPGDEAYAVAPTNRDAVAIGNPNGRPDNIVIDHSTFTWSVDEILSAWGPYGNVTFRNVIASEPLNDSIHIDEGATTAAPHGFGPMFDNQPDSKVTLIGSLLSHAEGRIPYAMSSEYVQVNNVFYDRINTFNRLNNQRSVPTQSSLVGNIFKNGPSLADWAVGKRPIEIGSGFVSESRVYLADNVALNHAFPVNGQWDLVDNNSSLTQQQLQLSEPAAWNEGLTAKPAEEVFDWVMGNAGARPADRLPYEDRIVDQAIDGNGTVVDSIAEAGGWPVVAEHRRALVIPKNPAADQDGDGYTNLEEWLESYAAFVEGRGEEPPLIAPEDGEPVEEENGDTAPTIISGLTVLAEGQQGNPWTILNNFKEGDLAYGDRAFKLESVSPLVRGGSRIMPNANSKNYQGAEVLASFSLLTDADVYLAFDDRMVIRPDWLAAEGWTDSGEEIRITGDLPFSLYTKRFTAGSTVTLWRSANKTNLFYIPIAKMIPPRATVTGAEIVGAGREFQASIKLTGVTTSVYEQDITLKYDESAFELLSINPAQPGTVVASVYSDTPGAVHIMTITGGGFNPDAEFLDVAMRAKAVPRSVTEEIRVHEAKLELTAGGGFVTAEPESWAIRIYNADLDGRNGVGVGDLAILGFHLGKDENSPDWHAASIADLNGDGVVDESDLVLMVTEMLKQLRQDD